LRKIPFMVVPVAVRHVGNNSSVGLGIPGT